MIEPSFEELTGQMMELYREGKYADALQIVERNVDRFPEQSARTTVWKMCLLSLCGRADDTVSVFRQGLDAGLWWRNDVFSDSDLNAVRDLPDFQRLMTVSQEKYEAARTQVKRDYAVLIPEEPSGNNPTVVVLHGRNGNKESNIREWETARRMGWLVLLAQSTQPLFPGSYCWDDPAQGLDDLLFYYEHIRTEYEIDSQRTILAGFSQGSGMAIQTALSGRFAAHGFISIASWWHEPASLVPQTEAAKQVRGYFITGEKDHTFDTAKEIQKVLQANNLQFDEETHPDLAHEFPPDFEKSFDQAIDFIFKERE